MSAPIFPRYLAIFQNWKGLGRVVKVHLSAHYYIKGEKQIFSLDLNHTKNVLSDNACIEEKKRALKDEIQKIDEVLHRIIPK